LPPRRSIQPRNNTGNAAMAEQTKAPRRDPRFVNLEDANERAYWCKYFGVPLERLIEAVKIAGPSSHEVRAFLDAK